MRLLCCISRYLKSCDLVWHLDQIKVVWFDKLLLTSSEFLLQIAEWINESMIWIHELII